LSKYQSPFTIIIIPISAHLYFGKYPAMGAARHRWDAWGWQQEMSTGGCGISLDRDIVSKEFQ